MLIANPIYDVVFKFLMEDDESAKLLISAILEQEVVSLELLPQEGTIRLKEKSITLFRLDFAAKIKTDQGKIRRVLIELQKAKFTTDLIRFRRYLGKNYADPNNVIRTDTGHVNDEGKPIIKEDPIPIITIYFLGHRLEHSKAPVVKVTNRCVDLLTKEELTEKEEFIEKLNHESFIIQIPYLDEKRKSDLMSLLNIFDQKRKDGEHGLQIQLEELPEKYHAILRRLQRAIVEEEIVNVMDIEDDILKELINRDHDVMIALHNLHAKEKEAEESKKEAEESKKEAEESKKEAEESKKALEEKDKVLEEKDKVLEEKDKVLEEKDKVLEESKQEMERLKKELAKLRATP